MVTRSTRTTTDHEEIRRWAEERGGRPACVKGTGRGTATPESAESRSLREISWDGWFRAFDENDLALIYQDRAARGQKSNFDKLVGRDSVEERKRGNAHASRHRKAAGKPASTSRGRRETRTTAARSRKTA